MSACVCEIPAVVHGRLLIDAPEGEADWLLFGCHGYAQQAEDMLAGLHEIALPGPTLRASLQGLHAFYAKGRPGASWMTSAQRERRLEENLAYVAAALHRLRGECRFRRVAWCGFSQGAAMAYRAAAALGGEALVVNGGDLPPDLDERDRRRLPPVLIGRGGEDPAYQAEQMAADAERLRAAGVAVTLWTGEGGHVWSGAWVERAARWLAETKAGPAGATAVHPAPA